VRLAPHTATTRNVAGAYPLLSSPALPPSMLIGTNIETGGAFCYDPKVLYLSGHLRGTNMGVFGLLGIGKSALAKVLAGRGSLFGRKSFVISPKPDEWTPLGESLGAEIVKLEPGGDTRVNPLTGMGSTPTEQLSRLVAIAEAVLGRQVTMRERGPIRAVLDDVRRNGEVTVPALANAGGWSEADEVRFALAELVAGELGGMFDGPTTSGLRLDGHVILDLGALWNSSELSLAMVAAAGWMRALVTAKDRHPRNLIVDECWKVGPTGAELLTANSKLSRSFGLSVVLIVHKLADLEVAGDKGSRVQGLVANLLADLETRVIFRPPADQLEPLGRSLGLTDTELARLSGLDVGCALWKIGQKSFLVRHNLSDYEKAIVDTDAAMRGER
jgi:hypothetical protein